MKAYMDLGGMCYFAAPGSRLFMLGDADVAGKLRGLNPPCLQPSS
jgi:hypothetical protein